MQVMAWKLPCCANFTRKNNAMEMLSVSILQIIHFSLFSTVIIGL